MHDAMIGDIGKVSALRVISTTTARTYQDTKKSIPEIATEIGVNTIIEPSVLCLGDSVCLRLKALSAYPEEKQLWVHDFKVEKSQILSMYSIVTKDIADRINVALTQHEEKRLAEARTVDLEAYDTYLKGQLIGDASLESLNKAKEFLNSAIEKDPDWAPLYSCLAGIWLAIHNLWFESPSVTTPRIYENLNKALELDPDLSDAHRHSAMIAQLIEWNWAKSEKEFLKALALNPNDARSRLWYAHLLCTLQRPEEAKMQGQLAFELDPLNPLMKCWYGTLLNCVGDCESALAIVEEVVAADPEHYLANNIIEGAAFCLRDYEKTIKAARYSLPFPIEEDAFREIEKIFYAQGFVAAYEDIMKQMEEFASNNPIPAIDMALRYIMVNQPDKAMDWLEKGFEIHDPKMRWITQIYNLDTLFTNPRFIDIVEKMNLPLP
jgi:tetratricopeptide (TPR) repeat protein